MGPGATPTSAPRPWERMIWSTLRRPLGNWASGTCSWAYDPKGDLNNAWRLTGLHETSNINDFSASMTNCGSRTPIPRIVERKRVTIKTSANRDPFLIMKALICTSSLFFKTWMNSFKFIYLFICLCQTLIVACRIFTCGMWDLAPWSGIEPGPPSTGSMES